MMELYVVSVTATGEIKNSGSVDRSKTPDGSTVYERITNYLQSHPDLKVNYFSNQELPDKYTKQIVNDELVNRLPDFKIEEELEQERIDEFILEREDLKGFTIQQKEDWVKARLQETTLDTLSKIAFGQIFRKIIAYTD